jgi:signal transduction histidine kinase
MTVVTHSTQREAQRAAAPRANAAVAGIAEAEAERAAVARMLHDEVMQTLVTARWLAERSGDEQVRDAVRDAMAEATATMWRLRPRTSDGRLVQALDQLADRYPDRVVCVRADGVPDVLNVAVATVAFRVVQAALAACTGRTVEVRVAVLRGVLEVAMCDDGPPYEAALAEPDSELTRWLARAGALGGSARVGDGLTGGTTLLLELPDVLTAVPPSTREPHA